MNHKLDNQVVRCPFCKKQRLFDVTFKSRGIIKIKCLKCAQIVEIDLEKVHTVLSK